MESEADSAYQLIVAAEERRVRRPTTALAPLWSLFPGPESGARPWLDDQLQSLVDPSVSGFEIVMPAEGEVRARKIISRSRRVMTGKYPSWKMGRFMHWESRLESKVFRLLDACPAIYRFAEQPFTIRYLSNGEWHSHVPDIVVETCFGDRWILEVKSSKDRSLADALERAKVLSSRLQQIRCKYAIVHQRAIETGASLENVCQLLKHGRKQPTAKAHQAFLELISSESRLSRKRLLGKAIEGDHAIRTGAQLVLRGYLSPSWGQIGNDELEFCLSGNDNNAEALQWLLRALGVDNQL